MKLEYFILDVFTSSPLAGNPLAVVRNADELSAGRMQAIAHEFNLSETVFLQTPRDLVNTARARIFTPQRELPFAGHPTIGTAVLIAERDGREHLGRQDMLIALEEEIGLISCTVRRPKGRATIAEFDLVQLPQESECADAGLIAQAIGLDANDIGFDAHVPSVFSAGLGFTFVPVASLEAIGRAAVNLQHWREAIRPADHPNVYLYTRETVDETHHVHARMFAPLSGIPEDPATGSAAAAFAGVAMKFEKPEDGEHILQIEQGYEMGRPSLINLTLDVRGGALARASIGGAAVTVMRGTLEL